jgi:hypothetical protein
LLKDPKFLVIPQSIAFTSRDFEVVLETFEDRPPIKARKGDGPFEVRTVWAAVGPDKEVEHSLCLDCLDKEVEANACARQGHLTLAPLAALSKAAEDAVSWLSDREPATPSVIFNHRIDGTIVRTHSGRVSMIDSPSGGAHISSPDHPAEEIILPAGDGPWVAVHPWPSRKGVD